MGIIELIGILMFALIGGVFGSMIWELKKSKKPFAAPPIDEDGHAHFDILPDVPTVLPSKKRSYRTADEVAIEQDMQRMKRGMREQ